MPASNAQGAKGMGLDRDETLRNMGASVVCGREGTIMRLSYGKPYKRAMTKRWPLLAVDVSEV